MFDQVYMRRGFALALLLVLSACAGGAQTPPAPSLVPGSPVPTAIVSLPTATAEPQPSLVPTPSPTASTPTSAASPTPTIAPSPAPPTATLAPSPSPPPPTVDIQSSPSCIP